VTLQVWRTVDDVKAPNAGGQVVLLRDILPGMPDAPRPPAASKTAGSAQHRVPLPAKLRHDPSIDRQIVDGRQHMKGCRT
jgi:hypothetical protein